MEINEFNTSVYIMIKRKHLFKIFVLFCVVANDKIRKKKFFDSPPPLLLELFEHTITQNKIKLTKN